MINTRGTTCTRKPVSNSSAPLSARCVRCHSNDLSGNGDGFCTGVPA